MFAMLTYGRKTLIGTSQEQRKTDNREGNRHDRHPAIDSAIPRGGPLHVAATTPILQCAVPGIGRLRCAPVVIR